MGSHLLDPLRHRLTAKSIDDLAHCKVHRARRILLNSNVIPHCNLQWNKIALRASAFHHPWSANVHNHAREAGTTFHSKMQSCRQVEPHTSCGKHETVSIATRHKKQIWLLDARNRTTCLQQRGLALAWTQRIWLPYYNRGVVAQYFLLWSAADQLGHRLFLLTKSLQDCGKYNLY
jgi:hypothetical protein